MRANILVIEDEVNISSSLEERLMMEGYQVWTALDGRKGLQLFHDHAINLVITDILMPEMDGLEVVRTLRRRSPAIPIIAMSGGGKRDLDFLVEAKEFGASQTISKPFHPEALVEMVRDLLHSFPPPSQ